MAIVKLPIAGGFYVDESRPISAQECTNLIPRIQNTDAQAQPNLIGTPGLSLYAEALNSQFARGAITQDGLMYTVNGLRLYRIDEGGTVTDLGEIEGPGRVSIASNGTQICIVVPGLKGYIYSVAGGLVEITDVVYTTTLGPSKQVVFKDGYFAHYNGSRYFISSLNDGLVFDALDFGTAEVDPDGITGIHVNRNILYVCGTNTIEPVQNVGGAGFPFQRIEGAVIQKGVTSQFSLAEFSNSFVFIGKGLGENPSIWQFAGSGVAKISTSAIDKILRELTTTQLAAAFVTTYASRGGFFVTFHLFERSFTFDSTASAALKKPVWHERKSKNSEGVLINWRVADIVDAYGLTLVTDRVNGNIGILDDDVYTEYGTTVNRVVSGPFLHNQGQRFSIAAMELTCESGVGNTLPPGDNPMIRREFSDDGGFAFSGGLDRALGMAGQHKVRQRWYKEGQVTRTRVYRFIVDAPVKVVIIKLEADIK